MDIRQDYSLFYGGSTGDKVSIPLYPALSLSLSLSPPAWSPYEIRRPA